MEFGDSLYDCTAVVDLVYQLLKNICKFIIKELINDCAVIDLFMH